MKCCFRPNTRSCKAFLFLRAMGKPREVIDGKVQCSSCKEFKFFGDFFKCRGKGRLGIESACKVCNMAKKKARKPLKIITLEKTCLNCSITLSKEQFPKWRNICKKCVTLESYARDSYEINWRKANKKKSELLEKELKLQVSLALSSIVNDDGEVWKNIPNFEGKYQASDRGRVRCLPHIFRNDKNTIVSNTELYIVKESYQRGYKRTTLRDFSGKAHSKGTHRWVMYAFHGESDLQVDHINGIKDDNRLVNLRYSTPRDNNNYKKSISPERYSSPLIGAYLQKGKWYSYLNINGVEHYLGNYDSDEKASEKYITALHNWETKQELPPTYINPDKTSKHDGIDFHGVSRKWRVRDSLKNYIGIFELEDTAKRVLDLVEFLISREIPITKQLIKKVRLKYGKDNRFKNPILDKNTGIVYGSISSASKANHISPKRLKKHLEGDIQTDLNFIYANTKI